MAANFSGKLYSQSSAFHFIGPTSFSPSSTITLSQNTIKNCYGAEKGGAFRVEYYRLNLAENIFDKNSAIYGGSISAKNAFFTSIVKNTFSNGRSWQGGDYYISNPINSVSLDSNQH